MLRQFAIHHYDYQIFGLLERSVPQSMNGYVADATKILQSEIWRNKIMVCYQHVFLDYLSEFSFKVCLTPCMLAIICFLCEIHWLKQLEVTYVMGKCPAFGCAW
jgi:hypothetical protein